MLELLSAPYKEEKEVPLRVDPNTAAQDWATGLANATPKIQRGIQRVQQAPGAKAAAASDKWLAGVQASQGKFARNVGAVSLAEWQAAASAAVGRVAEGAQMKQQKFATRIAPVFQHMANVLSTVDQMPTTSHALRVQKAVAFMNGMHQYQSPGS